MLETATIGGACKPPGPICLWMHVSLETYEQGPSAPAHSFEILTETDIRLSQLDFVFHFLFLWEVTGKKVKFALFLILKWELWESFIIEFYKQPLLRVVKHPESEHPLLRFVKQSRGTQPLLRVVYSQGGSTTLNKGCVPLDFFTTLSKGCLLSRRVDNP